MAKRKKKEKARNPIDEIKKMESKKRKEVEKKVEDKISFDVWWSLRHSLIPKIHKKEVIFANFKAWGLSKSERMVDFDMALAKYGIKF